jgi:hypothetical protein
VTGGKAEALYVLLSVPDSSPGAFWTDSPRRGELGEDKAEDSSPRPCPQNGFVAVVAIHSQYSVLRG